MTIDFNFDLTWLDGSKITENLLDTGNPQKASLVLSKILQMDGKVAPEKNLYWAGKLIESGLLELDEHDIKKLDSFIEKTSFISFPIIRERLREKLR